ncbi:molybdate ABC transporter permease subunit [Pseudodesulfovibrio piezophilus]|uniref:Molybdenum ABC-transporter, permease protein (ModB)-like n=1 Tax=Pseudodesulfovibrio piezophilus (strain DSM 21447 / JCM 15486 / C1TLV30) TaxID=1322246 RepID=M1WRY8_PSEP2|nr:ABC transporter permease subunit [Pseudodesulfovibrio piezophilus]CCH48612.1 Molybdenum ABC-transporter, permease protein (ModB)-like [Pseudodesulfovibrio piezophilus C1TLV30]
MDFVEILIQPETLGPLWLTTKVLVIAGCFHLLIGILLGYYLTNGQSMMRLIVDFFVTLPLVFPPIATGFILLMLLGRAGLIGRHIPFEIVFSFSGVVLASFISGLPLIVKPLIAALRGDVGKLAETAKILGKSDWQIFWLVLLPNVKKNIAAGWFLALGRSLGEVGITLMLGGNIIGRTNTLSLEIYNSVFTGEFERAIILSSLIGVFSLGIFTALKRLSAI